MEVKSITEQKSLLAGLPAGKRARLHRMLFEFGPGNGTLMLLPIFIAEWSKQYRPQFVRTMLRATIATYLGVYLVLFLTVNVTGVVQVKQDNSDQTRQAQSLE